MGVAKKETKCVIYYNTHMHSVDTGDQYLVHHPFIRKTVKWPKKVFLYLLQCCSLNSYVNISTNNPYSCKLFLDFMSDIILTFWTWNYFFSFSTPVYKMRILQEPNKIEL